MGKIQSEYMLVYINEINHTILPVLYFHGLKLMLLQYFGNAEQDNGFTEHKGTELFKVICEFKYI